MWKRTLPIILIGLMTASVAEAQGGGRGGRGGSPSSRPAPSSSSSSNPPSSKAPLTPVDKIVIVGVVTAIDLPASRITIAYDAVDALDWPKGTMPFAVSKPDLLNGVTVGEKVSFRLESQQIYDLTAYKPPPPPEY